MSLIKYLSSALSPLESEVRVLAVLQIKASCNFAGSSYCLAIIVSIATGLWKCCYYDLYDTFIEISSSTDVSTAVIFSSPTALFPHPITTMVTMLPTATPQTSLPENTPSAAAATDNYRQYTIILGATTGVFLVTTLVCSAIVMVMCCQKINTRRSKRQPKESGFEGRY